MADYTAKHGDSLWSIAENNKPYGYTTAQYWAELKAANKGKKLFSGTKVNLPSGGAPKSGNIAGAMKADDDKAAASALNDRRIAAAAKAEAPAAAARIAAKRAIRKADEKTLYNNRINAANKRAGADSSKRADINNKIRNDSATADASMLKDRRIAAAEKTAATANQNAQKSIRKDDSATLYSNRINAANARSQAARRANR